jgi:hypothetical protein
VASLFTERSLGHDRRHGDRSTVNGGVLEPRQRLTEFWLTDELGVGSGPIRETVCRLVADEPPVGNPDCGIVATHPLCASRGQISISTNERMPTSARAMGSVSRCFLREAANQRRAL